MNTKKTKQPKTCCRCGDLPLIELNTGKTKLRVCLVCWLGLAMAMERDLNIWRRDPGEFIRGMYQGLVLKKQVKKYLKHTKHENNS